MKQVYGSIKPVSGLHVAGIINLEVVPREWLAADPEIDFITGKVLNILSLVPGKFMLGLQLVHWSYLFDEIPKESKSGDYYQVSLSGSLNTFNYQVQQYLSTLKQSELVAIVTDRNKKKKVIGDTASGMKLSVGHTQKNDPHKEEVQIELYYECEDFPPYYNIDNSPDILGNYLIDSDGNYLLVS